MLADYGYPLVDEVYIVAADMISGQRDLLKAVPQGRDSRVGWTT